jgi:hypothetical protein
MATTTNYGWTTPDDTALVKDGAAAIRTLGTSVDTTTKALNPSTTLGDIEYRSSTANTNTRLGIGSTGNVLTVAGGVPSWAAPAGGGANWSLLNSGGTALSGATTTVSGISSKDQVMVLFNDVSTNTAGSFIYVRFNTDSGSNYTSYGALFEPGSTYAASIFQRSDFTATIGAPIAGMSAAASSSLNGYLLLSGGNASGVKVFNSVGQANASGSTNQLGIVGGGFWNNSATITSVSLFTSGGTFDSGTMYVYTSA